MGSQRVTRLRSLSDGQLQRLQALRRVAEVLDNAIPVPGTSFRFGLDPLIGLIPAFGDLVSPLFTLAILWHGHDLQIPRVVQLRMILNVAIDTVIGMVPIIGDAFDFAWKANVRNMALLEAHAYEEAHATVGDWLFVSAMIGLLVVIAVVPFVVAAWALGAVFRAVTAG